MQELLVGWLVAAFNATESEGWRWFEDVLAYDNARLSQALIVTGTSFKRPALVKIGLHSLRWLMTMQTTQEGYFRPIGTASFGAVRKTPQVFDQQPVEAAAAISACLAAWQVNESAEWATETKRAFNWFLGDNDLRTSLVDSRTGGCLDGLHPDRPNQNRGAESALSYLLALTEIRQWVRAGVATSPAEVAHNLVLSA